MAYDTCHLCRKFAKEQYTEMTECCDREGCPGVAKRERFKVFIEPLLTRKPSAAIANGEGRQS